MGSFSSKVRSPSNGKEHCEATEVEVNASGTAENSVSRPNEASNEDNSEVTSKNDEQHLPPKFRQSFSWLVDTPVVLTTGTGKEQKSKGKRCVDGKDKTSSMLKYTNGRYLKSCQHFPEMPPSDSQQALTDAVQSSSSSSSSYKHVKCSTYDAKHEAGKGGLKVNQKSLGKRDVIPSTSGVRVGFGVDGTEQIGQTPSSKSRPTAYKGNI